MFGKMKLRYIIWGLILFAAASFYVNRNVYYISQWKMYVKIENNPNKDTTTVYFSNSRWTFGDNYVKYCPESPEISNLVIYHAGDSLYAREDYMDIIEIESKDYSIKQVRLVHGELIKGELPYWSDSSYLYNNVKGWISINHRHGIYTKAAK